MFKPRMNMGRSRALPRKLVGIALAVVGIALIADKVPPVVWWICLGVGMIIAGWKLFIG